MKAKALLKKVRGPEGKVRVFRRKAVYGLLQKMHEDLETIIDHTRQGVSFDLPQFDLMDFETRLRQIEKDIQLTAGLLEN